MSRRDQILSVLRAHQGDLRRRGILHLALFGSTARGEENPQSDIDLLAALDPNKRLSLFAFMDLEEYLSDLLKRPVDLVEESHLRPRIQARLRQDRISAF